MMTCYTHRLGDVFRLQSEVRHVCLADEAERLLAVVDRSKNNYGIEEEISALEAILRIVSAGVNTYKIVTVSDLHLVDLCVQYVPVWQCT